jgi:tripartite-type tricarboxylate transporter receptor subunit TctC
VFGPWSFGRPLVAPPEVPEERLKALRGAFAATMRDAKFLEEAKKINLEVQPVAAGEIDRLLGELYKTPQPVIEQARQVLGIGNR